MLNLAVSDRRSVISLDNQAFDNACAELMRIVARDRPPDLLIGIPTGGRVVAESMAKAAGGMPMLALTCRRPSTSLKPARSSVARKMIAGLPRPIVDRLRLVEHAMLNRAPASLPTAPYQFDEEELAAIEAWMAAATGRSSALIVDDAVDSGATLSQVIGAVRLLAPDHADIRAAVITVTTARPLVQPDYALFRGQLCRFPWSLDAR